MGEVIEGRMQVAFLEGPPGIGKTRLLQEVARRAATTGMTLVAGGCDQLDETRPFGVLADCLACAEPLDDARAAFAGLLVEDSVQGQGPEPAARHFQVADRFVELVESLAVADPVLLLVDDLHWADASTIYALRLVTRRLADLPVFLVAGLRPLPRTDELRHLIDRCARDGASHLVLPPLDHSESAALAELQLAATPARRLHSFLAAAGGNPLLVTELVDGLLSDRAIVVADGAADLVTAALPADLRATVLRRIGFLSDEALRLLRVASILGQAFAPAELALVANLSTMEVLQVVDEWISAGLVHAEGDELAFRHDVIREALYDDIPEGLRIALHLDAARALADSGAPATRVARHFSVAATPGDREAVQVMRDAASVSVGDPRSRAALLRRALELAPDGPDHESLVAELAEALISAGEPDEGLDLALGLLELDPEPDARRRARLTVSHGLWLASRHQQLVSEVNGWLLATDSDEVEQAWLRLYRALCTILTRADDEDWRPDADYALAVAETHGLDDLRVLAYIAMALGDTQNLRLDAAVKWGYKSVAVADGSKDPEVHRFNAHSFAAVALHRAGRFGDAERVLQAGVRLQEASGAVWSVPSQLANVAIIHADRGELDEAAVNAEAAIEVAEELKVRLGIQPACSVLCSVHTWRGDFEAAERYIGVAQGALGQGDPQATAGPTIRLQLARGETDAALAAVAQEYRNPMATHLLFAVEVLPAILGAGARPLADEIVSKLESTLSRRPNHLEVFLTACQAMVRDDADDLPCLAERCLATGFFRAAFVAEYTATLLAVADRRSEAEALFLRALERYEDGGAAWLSARLQAQMRALGLRPPRSYRQRRSSVGWEALTAAERRVAELAATGMTNPQIAERLVVSRRTIQTHVSHILAKLDLSSRVQLAAAVARSPQDGAH